MENELLKIATLAAEVRNINKFGKFRDAIEKNRELNKLIEDFDIENIRFGEYDSLHVYILRKNEEHVFTAQVYKNGKMKNKPLAIER